MNPVRSQYTYEYPLTCFCNQSFQMEYSCYNCRKFANLSSFIETNTTLVTNDETHLPNKALLSLIILLGTCFISIALKRFRRSHFFSRTVIIYTIQTIL